MRGKMQMQDRCDINLKKSMNLCCSGYQGSESRWTSHKGNPLYEIKNMSKVKTRKHGSKKQLGLNKQMAWQDFTIRQRHNRV